MPLPGAPGTSPPPPPHVLHDTGPNQIHPRTGTAQMRLHRLVQLARNCTAVGTGDKLVRVAQLPHHCNLHLHTSIPIYRTNKPYAPLTRMMMP